MNVIIYINVCQMKESREVLSFEMKWREINLFSNQKVYIRKSVNLLQLLQIIVNAK